MGLQHLVIILRGFLLKHDFSFRTESERMREGMKWGGKCRKEANESRDVMRSLNKCKKREDVDVLSDTRFFSSLPCLPHSWLHFLRSLIWFHYYLHLSHSLMRREIYVMNRQQTKSHNIISICLLCFPSHLTVCESEFSFPFPPDQSAKSCKKISLISQRLHDGTLCIREREKVVFLMLHLISPPLLCVLANVFSPWFIIFISSSLTFSEDRQPDMMVDTSPSFGNRKWRERWEKSTHQLQWHTD